MLRSSICEWLLVVVVVFSALAIGSVHVPVLLAVSALALAGAAIELLAVRRVPWPALVLTTLALFSAFQALPLPASWVSRLSPATAGIWLRCLVPFGEPALRHFSLSLDAGASCCEALKWLTYASVYILASRMRTRRGSAWLALLLFGSAALVTLITLAHGVMNSTVLFGFYHPEFAVGRWSVGPLLNSNNLAGYAILGLFAGVGLVLSGRSPLPRLPLLIGIGVISTALCLSGSRAGVSSVVLGGLVSVVWLASSPGARFSAANLALGAAPFVVAVLVAVALGSASDAHLLASVDMRRKASVWLWAVPMIRDHALFGVGRGAFESAFPPYREALDYDWSLVVTHAENFVVQWIAEWGVLVGASALVLIVGYVLREWYGSRTDRLRFMVMTGTVALLVQNLADLGLEIPAVAIAAVLALAAGERSAKTQPSESANRIGNFRFALAAAAFGLWLAAFAWSRLPVERERRQVSLAYHELALKSPDARARFRDVLHQAMLRHPGESYFPLLGALVAIRAREGDALPWIARSLELAPTYGPVHLALAQLLHAHGATTQAMLHLRLAAQYDHTLGGAVSSSAPLWAASLDQVMQAMPDGPYGDGLLLEACVRVRAIQVKIECFRRATLRSPRSPEAQVQLADSLLEAIRARQGPCDLSLVEPCAAEAERALRIATKLEPKAWRPSYLMAKLLSARGDSAGAAKLLARVCPLSVEGQGCWDEAVEAAIKSGSNEAITVAADAFAVRPCGGTESCADMLATLASHLESGGQSALAHTFYAKAAEADPSAARWLKVGEHAFQAHLYGVARVALERADRSPDASASTRADAEMLRQRIARLADAPL